MKEVLVSCPVSGYIVPITEVKDELFASGIMGNGVGICPDKEIVEAPFDCSIEMIADTAHAVGVRDKHGIIAFIHIGIDTVCLKNKGFDMLVKKGDKVKAGTPIIKFDKKLIEAAGFDSSIIFIISDIYNDRVPICITGGHINSGDIIMRVRI